MINKIVNYIKDNNFRINYVNNSVNIINYDNILDATPEIVTLIKDNKTIKVRGNDLKISKLLDNEILITGKINKIEM